MPEEIHNFITQGAVFYVSHSGGKDSQAMYALLKEVIPPDQLVVVHASLGEVEWPGVIDHIRKNIDRTDDLNVVWAEKTLLGMVRKRGMWPSAKHRQCTSDLKRGPIFKFIRHDLKSRGSSIAINCMGLRAEESSTRAKRNPFSFNKMQSNSLREVWDWLPVFYLKTNEIFRIIADAGQKPFWSYKKNDRLSCVFCIMGSVNDLRHGAEQNPELFRRYVELEKEIGHTIFTRRNEPIYLEDHIGMKVEECQNLS